MVDYIVHLGMALKLLSGVSIDDHHGLDSHTAKDLIEKEGWYLEHWTRFQFGLNNEMLFSHTSSLQVRLCRINNEVVSKCVRVAGKINRILF